MSHFSLLKFILREAMNDFDIFTIVKDTYILLVLPSIKIF